MKRKTFLATLIALPAAVIAIVTGKESVTDVSDGYTWTEGDVVPFIINGKPTSECTQEEINFYKWKCLWEHSAPQGKIYHFDLTREDHKLKHYHFQNMIHAQPLTNTLS